MEQTEKAAPAQGPCAPGRRHDRATRTAEAHPRATTLLEEAGKLFLSHWRTPHNPPRSVSATGLTSWLPPPPVIALEGYPWLSHRPSKRLKLGVPGPETGGGAELISGDSTS
ncbi:uncharacterized protein [Macaca nemestrina]|uniref:uncharacterized protein isoform X3 n=1 Tax=Macaca nemestrina TaxID=9545 RepID=UPI0039B9AD4E